jgi:hypothetical protein
MIWADWWTLAAKVIDGVSVPATFTYLLGLADHVIVVLSDKYLSSPYCMTELYSICQR